MEWEPMTPEALDDLHADLCAEVKQAVIAARLKGVSAATLYLAYSEAVDEFERGEF